MIKFQKLLWPLTGNTTDNHIVVTNQLMKPRKANKRKSMRARIPEGPFRPNQVLW